MHYFSYVICCLLYLLFFSTSYAVSPETWTESTEADFKNGKIENASWTSEGVIMLSPQHKTLFSSSEPYIWSLANDKKGNIYAGSGTNGIIYKIEPDGMAKVFFESHQIGVHAMVVDSKGNQYAGTSKEGIIYKITPNGYGSVFYDSPESYIWTLAIDKDDNLYAGTGGGGMLIKITPDGNSKVLYDSPESHILSIILDKEGDVLAGSGNEGRIYKVTQKDNRVFCVYDTSEPEVRALALDSKDNIYAATSPTMPGALPFDGPKMSSAKIYKIDREGDVKVIFGMPSHVTSVQPQFPHPEPTQAMDSDVLDSIISSMPPITGPISLPPVPITPPKTVAETEVPVRFLALAVDKDDNVYTGSGDKGMLYKIMPEEEIVTLMDIESREVLTILPLNNELYFGTGNPGGIHKLSMGYADRGNYTSSVHDGQFLSAWGKAEWDADLPEGTFVTIQTRSGNTDEPGELWSDWSEEYKDAKGSAVTSPGARFIQFRANLYTEEGNLTPLLREVRLIYLTRNQPPSLSKPGPDGQVLQGPQQPEVKASNNQGNNNKGARRYVLSGERNIGWSATDPNNDTLIYDLYYRNIKDEKWRKLEEDVELTSYTIDTVKFSDGIYLIKVVASDRPSNTVGNDRQVEKVSEELIIDNTPPQVMLKDAEYSKEGRVNINGAVQDNMSIIVQGEYCLNNEEWRTFLPDDGIFDSKSEKFHVVLKEVEEGENTVSVKVMDEAGNTGVSSITFK